MNDATYHLPSGPLPPRLRPLQPYLPAAATLHVTSAAVFRLASARLGRIFLREFDRAVRALLGYPATLPSGPVHLRLHFDADAPVPPRPQWWHELDRRPDERSPRWSLELITEPLPTADHD